MGQRIGSFLLMAPRDSVAETLHAMRAEMARLLREVAADEEPRVASRLREIAAAFECGQGSRA